MSGTQWARTAVGDAQEIWRDPAGVGVGVQLPFLTWQELASSSGVGGGDELAQGDESKFPTPHLRPPPPPPLTRFHS